MCRLVSIETNIGTVDVADIKANIIKRISEIAPVCPKIDCIYVFGSSVEDRCTPDSDIDIAIVSNSTKSKLYADKNYREFTTLLYNIDLDQDYDILQFKSIDAIQSCSDAVCKDIMTKGRMIYRK